MEGVVCWFDWFRSVSRRSVGVDLSPRVRAAVVVHRRAARDRVEPGGESGVLLQAADVAEGVQPDLLQDVGDVVFVVDQPVKKVVEPLVPAGDEFVPRGQVSAPAAEVEQFVADLLG